MFCYITAGAGKTYTMFGTREHPGIMVPAIKDLLFKVLCAVLMVLLGVYCGETEKTELYNA